MSEIEIVDSEIIIPIEDLESNFVDERTPLEKLYDDMLNKDSIVKKIRKGVEGVEGDLEKAWIIYIKANNKYFDYLDELRGIQVKKEIRVLDSFSKTKVTTPGAQILPI